MTRHGYLLPTRGAVVASEGGDDLAGRVRADVVDLATLAEGLGFDAVWVGDSVLAKPRLEPLSTLAAVATRTEHVGLGTAVYLPTLRHPVLVAHQTATVDQLSGGRLAVGVGVGVRPDERAEQEQLGIPFERRGAVLDETLTAVERLWRGESVELEGEFVSFEGASLGFGPVSPPPIYVASAAFDPADGFPRRIRERLATRADGWLPIALPAESYAAGLAVARSAVERAGRDPLSLEPAYYQDVVIAETEAAALERARAFLLRYYPDDQLTYLPEGAFDDDQLRRRGAFGPPAVVRAHLDRYEAAGVETFVTRFPSFDQRGQLRAFAELIDPNGAG